MAEPTLFDEASLALIASGGAGKDGKVYSVKPVPVYGPELVTNGDFATDSDWSKFNATISGGVATMSVVGGALTRLYQSVSYTSGREYRVTASLQGLSGSRGKQIRVMDNGSNLGGLTTSNGLITLDESVQIVSFYWTANANSDLITFERQTQSGDYEFVLDNVSVKEVITNGDFDFSRGSNLSATRVGPTGLIEKGRENLLTQSNDFTTWGLDDVTITSGQGGYDGTNNATKVLGNTNSSRHNLIRSFSLTAPLAISIYVKASGHNYIQIASATTSGQYINFDLSDGSIGNVGGDAISEYVEDIGGGWYRIGFVTGRSLNSYYISLVSSKTAGWLESWAMPNATDGVLIQSAQIEQGLAVTPYIESFATTGKAGLLEDEPRFDYSGGASCPSLLLEPSRTNLVGQSEYFGGSYWTIGGASFVSGLSSPEGLSNAYELKEGANNGFHFFYDNGFTIVNGTSYTMSVFVKYNGRQWFRLLGQFGNSNQQAYFDVQNGVTGSKDAGVVSGIEDYGNGWYRVYLTATSDGTAGRYRGYLAITDGDPSYQGDDTSGVYLYGATFEQGSYPTSYIPTYGVSATRASDDCNKTGVSDLIGQTEGTIFAEFTPSSDLNTEVFQLLATNSIENVVTIACGAGKIYGVVYTNSGYVANFSISQTIPNNTFKVALCYKNNDITFFINGQKVASNTNAYSGQADLTKILFNNQFLFGKQIVSYKKTLVFKNKLSDTECIKLTTI